MISLMAHSGRLRRPIAVIVAASLAIFVWWAVRTPAGGASLRAFEPDRIASLELDMWKAYYAKERVSLFRLLIVTLHEQYHASWARATLDALRLARAAARFAEIREGYDVVLPDLETAYASIKATTRSSFDPRSVARAELAWWIARRIPGQDSPEQVGDLMADEYAQLYEVAKPRVLRAAVLRAEAGKLRDDQAAAPDWPTIERLLRESYRELKAGIQTG